MENSTLEQTTDTRPKKSALQIALGMSVFTGIILSVYSIITYVTKTYDNTWINFLVETIICATTVILCIKNYRDKENGGNISFGKAFGIGYWVTFIGTIISTIFFIIFSRYIAPDFQQHIMDVQRKKMEAGGMSDEQINAQMNMPIVHFFQSPAGTFLIVVVFGGIFAVVLALICAAIMKRESSTLNYPQ